MPQTTHYGFPLWADTPPNGATGKDLRDAILGEGEGSLANRMDSELSRIEGLQSDWNVTDESDPAYIRNKPFGTIPDNLETTDNKLTSYNGTDGSWWDVTPEKYPSSQAVYDFVRDYVSNYAATSNNFHFFLSRFIEPFLTVEVERFDWDGVTDGHFGLLGQYYKISDNTEFPDACKVSLSEIDKSTEETTVIPIYENFLLNYTMADLKDAFGIVVYCMKDGNFTLPVVAVADRAGTLPAALIEQLMGENPGTDVPYEAGTYVLFQDDESYSLFVSKAAVCMPVKKYIDAKCEELKATLSPEG